MNIHFLRPACGSVRWLAAGFLLPELCKRGRCPVVSSLGMTWAADLPLFEVYTSLRLWLLHKDVRNYTSTALSRLTS